MPRKWVGLDFRGPSPFGQGASILGRARGLAHTVLCVCDPQSPTCWKVQVGEGEAQRTRRFNYRPAQQHEGSEFYRMCCNKNE